MFKLIQEKYLKNLDVTYFEFEHDKTKAKHYHLKCNDKENAFMVSFNTLPYSDNGVMHILEHSCLMGSKKFPVKSIPTAVRKKSLLTFLNASTSSNKTVYPIASANKKDFFNLIDVYLDSAFFPLLRKETFLQEGWRYEFEEPENANSKLKITGVVFNEMLGKTNSTNYKLHYAITQNLYPESAYSINSGGEPLDIPNLSYEEFKDYHKTFYHPSNATFLTYGDANIEEIQNKIEENVLNKFDYKKISNNAIVKQTPFVKVKNITVENPYAKDDFADKHYYLKVWNINDFAQQEETMITSLFSSLIAGDASAIMRKALEDSKLVTSPICHVNFNSKDISIVIGGAGIKEENFDKLDALILKTLNKIAKNGFTKETLNKVLHSFELSFKEKHTKNGSLGVAALYDMSYTLAIDGISTLDILEEYKVLDNLKEKLKDPAFFKNFTKNKILNNNHAINLKFIASNKADIEYKQKLAKLAENKEKTLTENDKLEIIKQHKDLVNFQNDNNELNCLPEFSIADIPAEVEVQELEQIEKNGIKVSAFTAPTNGLTHFSKVSFLQHVKASDLKYYTLYSTLFNQLGYGKFNYEQRSENIANVASYIRLSIQSKEDSNHKGKYFSKLKISSKMLNRNTKKVKTLIDDIIYNLRFDEKERIISTLEKINLQNQNSFGFDAHFVSANIAKASFDDTALIQYTSSGIGFDLYLKQLVHDIKNDDIYNNLIIELKKVHEKVIQAYQESALLIIDTADNLNNSVDDFFDKTIITKPKKYDLDFNIKHIDLTAVVTERTTANACAMALKGLDPKHKLAGTFLVLTKIINNNYIFTEVREKGGAYTAGAFYANKSLLLISSRDPNISKTFKIYKNLEQWLQDDKNFNSETIEQGILMAIADLDKPHLKEIDCVATFTDFINDIDKEVFINFRNSVLNTDLETIKTLIKEYILPNFKNASFASLANKNQFENEKIPGNTVEY